MVIFWNWQAAALPSKTWNWAIRIVTGIVMIWMKFWCCWLVTWWSGLLIIIYFISREDSSSYVIIRIHNNLEKKFSLVDILVKTLIQKVKQTLNIKHTQKEFLKDIAWRQDGTSSSSDEHLNITTTGITIFLHCELLLNIL